MRAGDVTMNLERRISVLEVLGPASEPAGVADLFSLFEHLDPERVALQIACNLSPRRRERARDCGQPVHPLPGLDSGGAWRGWRGFAALVRLLREHRFEVIHTWGHEAGYWGRLAARLCRVPALVHTFLELPLHPLRPAWKRRLFLARERRLRPSTHCFTASCDAVRDEAATLGLLDGEHAHTVYPGLDYAVLTRRTDHAALRRDLALPEGWATVMMVSPLDRLHAPELILEAMHALVRAHPRTLLLIAGDGPRRARCESLIARRGLRSQVRLLGDCPAVMALLRAANVVALSARGEDMGHVLRAAMLLGKPVVAPELDTLRDVVRHGETGLLYEAGKAHQLASHLQYLLDHPPEQYRLGVNARRWSRPRLDVALSARRFERIYADVVADVTG